MKADMPPATDLASIAPTMPAKRWTKATDDPRPAMKIGGGDLAHARESIRKNPDMVYSASIVTMRSTDGGQTWIELARRARRRRLPEHLDQSRKPRHHSAGQRPGRASSASIAAQTWGSWYNQPTAQLYHVAVTNTLSLSSLRGPAGERLRLHLQPRQRWRDHLPRLAPVRHHRIRLCRPRPARIPRSSTARDAAEVSRYDMRHRPGAKRHAHSRAKRRASRRPHRANPVFARRSAPDLLRRQHALRDRQTTAKTWKTISPDLSREHSGQPDVAARSARKRCRATRRGAIYAVAASFQECVDTFWAGTDDGLMWITQRSAARTGRTSRPPAHDSVEQGDPDQRLALRRHDRVCLRKPLPHRRSASVHLPHPRWRAHVAAHHRWAARRFARQHGARRLQCARACCLPAPRLQSGCRSTMATTGSRSQYNLPHTSMRDLMVQGQRPDRGHTRALFLGARRYLPAAPAHALKSQAEPTSSNPARPTACAAAPTPIRRCPTMSPPARIRPMAQ